MDLNALLQTVLPKYSEELPKGTFLDAVSAVQDVIAQRLWLSNSDLLRDSFQATLTAGQNKIHLPSGTLGLVDSEWPWMSNSEMTPGQQLTPLPAWMRHTFSEEGHPRFFELRGLAITLFPAALVDTTLSFEIYSRPQTLCEMDEDLPWDGLFDQVFIEAVPRFNVIGGMITVTPEMEAFIHQRVDRLVDHRPAKSITWAYPA